MHLIFAQQTVFHSYINSQNYIYLTFEHFFRSVHLPTLSLVPLQTKQTTENSNRLSSGISHHPPPTSIHPHLAFRLRRRSTHCVMTQFISALVSNLTIMCLPHQHVWSRNACKMIKPMFYVVTLTFWQCSKGHVCLAERVNVFLTVLNLSLSRHHHVSLSWVLKCIKFPVTAILSSWTQLGGKKKVEKRKRKHHLCP